MSRSKQNTRNEISLDSELPQYPPCEECGEYECPGARPDYEAQNPITGDLRARLDAGDQAVREGRVSRVPMELLEDIDDASDVAPEWMVGALLGGLAGAGIGGPVAAAVGVAVGASMGAYVGYRPTNPLGEAAGPTQLSGSGARSAEPTAGTSTTSLGPLSVSSMPPVHRK